MRWKEKQSTMTVGDIRFVNKFLLFPKCINNEWRWFEKVSYQQTCKEVMNYASMDYGYHKEWINTKWM